MGKYREPIKYTCPDIDSVIEWIDDAIKSCDSKSDLENYTYEERINDVKYYLRGCFDKLEELRSANSTLRDWGNDINNELEEVEKERDEALDKVANLEDEIEDLKTQLDNAILEEQ